MSTIKDVAAAAGVSVATVSYVLNGTKRVSEAVEQRVLDAARRLNYRANATARNLRRSETRMIGYELPFPDLIETSTLMQRFAYGISIEASKYGFNIIMFGTPQTHTQIAQYQQLIHSGRVDGFIVSDTNWYDQRIEFLLDQEVPFVAFGRTKTTRHYSFVDIDGFDGISQVMNHLLEKGHRQIAFIGWPENSFTGDDRFSGYVETLKQAGIAVQYDLIRRCNNNIEGGYQAAQDLLNEDKSPTAIVCVSDLIAIGTLRYAQQHGLTIGDELAISGFDDLALTDYVTPALTTVSQPLQEVEAKVIELIIALIEGQPLEVDQMLIKPNLLIREST